MTVTLESLKVSLDNGAVRGDWPAKPGDATAWSTVGAWVATYFPPPSKPLTAATHCFVLSGSERRGPFVLSQIETMWQSGAITADARIEWEGADPVPVAVALARGSQARSGELSSRTRNESAGSATIVRQWRFALVGFLAGALLGFLLRPSVPLVGQLPFSVVVTRGASLQGLDQMLVPAACTSFNYMLVGAILGAVGGIVAARLTPKK